MKSDYNHAYLPYDIYLNYTRFFPFTIDKSNIDEDIGIKLTTNSDSNMCKLSPKNLDLIAYIELYTVNIGLFVRYFKEIK